MRKQLLKECGGTHYTQGIGQSWQDQSTSPKDLGQTGIDLPALIACTRALQRHLGRPLGSHVLVAGPVDWQR